MGDANIVSTASHEQIVPGLAVPAKDLCRCWDNFWDSKHLPPSPILKYRVLDFPLYFKIGDGGESAHNSGESARNSREPDDTNTIARRFPTHIRIFIFGNMLQQGRVARSF